MLMGLQSRAGNDFKVMQSPRFRLFDSDSLKARLIGIQLLDAVQMLPLVTIQKQLAVHICTFKRCTSTRLSSTVHAVSG